MAANLPDHPNQSPPNILSLPKNRVVSWELSSPVRCLHGRHHSWDRRRRSDVRAFVGVAAEVDRSNLQTADRRMSTSSDQVMS